MPRPLEHAVVVITGASSGIGRAAALRIARRGAALALCARGEDPLAEVAAECEAAGAEAMHRALDVADGEAVASFAAAAEERFGRIDVWGRVPSPQVSPYVTSKHAVRAFSECLHGELRDEPDIHVAIVVPEAVDPRQRAAQHRAAPGRRRLADAAARDLAAGIPRGRRPGAAGPLPPPFLRFWRPTGGGSVPPTCRRTGSSGSSDRPAVAVPGC
ncbi:MAG TPA: SDR family NAD(P)-dependent oxidoreductase [Solirubrobacterales bacterium]|nr:SDR family NAD(P)-dependent oxidoreductase [Solirubrobacterales bacterium]